MAQALTATSSDAQVMTGLWLDYAQLATLAGIAGRVARKALGNAIAGKNWRGHSLSVREVRGARGRGGISYQVSADTLPPDLRDKWFAENPIPEAEKTRHLRVIDATDSKPAAQPIKGTSTPQFRYGVIEPALRHPKNSSARRAAIQQLAEQQHTAPSGKRKTICEDTLYKWLADYETLGLTGLDRKKRADTGGRRTLLTRRWDTACPLPEETRQQIADQLILYIRSAWAEGVPGWKQVSRLASSKLVELSRAAGWNAPDETLAEVCRVTRKLAEDHRRQSLVAVHDKDARGFFDRHLPRITRNRDGLRPMDMVVGDVHPADIGVAREDGSIAYPRAVAWQDLATNRMHISLILLAKGEGVRREHVAASFAAMCEDWGLPLALYLDNGSEYNWAEMIQGFTELSALASRFEVRWLGSHPEIAHFLNASRTVIRARPYNAPAKPIEGLFGVLEGGFFSMIPGWVGGNRMTKKTHNVGKEPKPFPGDWDAFRDAIGTAMAHYHAMPQGGFLNGKSPNEAYAQAIEAGWTLTAVAAEALMMSFAEEALRTVDGGRVRWNATTYYDDKLLAYSRDRLRVRVARHDPRLAFVFDSGDTLICAVPKEKTFGFVDPAGAIEQGRREKEMRAVIRGLKADVVSLDLVKEMDRHVAALPAAPTAPVGSTVTLSGETRQMVEAHRALAASGELADVDQPIGPPPDLTQEQIAAAYARFDALEAGTPEPEPKPAPRINTVTGRPMFSRQTDRYEWLQAHPEAINDDDRAWLEEFKASAEYQVLYEGDDFDLAAIR